MKLDQKVALITGAGSGIGRAIAGSLARRGCHLALADINTDGLQETAELNKMNSVTISTHKLDVTDRDAVKALPPAILEAHGRIDLLINNAGVAAAGTFDRISEAHFDRVMAVNFDGVVSMTRTFLPFLQEQEEAVIANVSSLFGIISPPEQTAYSASKFAVRGFSNALRHELEATNVIVKACDQEPLMSEAIAYAGSFGKKRGIFQELKKRMHKELVRIIDEEDPEYIDPLNLFVAE